MKLSTRLMLFFLGALAFVLIGFSVTLYLTASKYLDRQADERLEGAINTLAAAAEVSPAGVEWEPDERRLSFGRRTVEGSFAWRITDEAGRRVDGSSSAELERLFVESSVSKAPARRTLTVNGGAWRVMRRSLERPPASPGSPVVILPGKHEALVISAGVSLEGVRVTLRNLVLVLAGLSSGLWALALVFGRRLCLRALRPVTEMAEAARAIGGSDTDERLPTPDTGDELAELGQSFNALLDRLRESFERQRRFTGDASHQLRTPLTVIQGHVDLALRYERPAEEYRQVLSLVQRRTRHLSQIIESLLYLARADAEVMQPQLVPTDLAGWLTEHVGSRHDPGSVSNVRLVIETVGPSQVRIQPSLAGELVNNLLDNARNYSEPGAPVVVRLRRDGGDYLLSVEDQGVGIRESEIPHIFKPFYRSTAARGKVSTGLGLGLSIAARLAKSIGGTIAVESRPGIGSTFTVRIPADDLR